MNKRITSKELAKLAGVSSATISRAFSGDSRISVETRTRILSIAQEHDYQPNALARSLNSQRSGLVALVVNSIQNPAEAEQLQYLVQKLQNRGLLPIILCCTGYDDKVHLMRMASSYQVDHVVVFSDMVSYDDAVQIFRSARPVIVSSEPLVGNHASHINIDGSEAVAEIVEKLIKDGRKSFAYLAGRKSSWIDKQRKQWFTDALSIHGLVFQAEANGDYSYDSGFKEAVVLLRRSKIDAIICGNDVMAIGVKDAATRVLGKQVPEDIAIVGQDGIYMSQWECHDLTTIALDAVEFIDVVVTLIERNEDSEVKPEAVTLKLKVQWGSTT